MTTTRAIIIVNLDSLEDMLQAFPLVQQVYPKMDLATYRSNVAEMMAMSNFKMIGAIYDGKLVGVSGYFILRMLYCGRYLQASNFVVDQNNRGFGIGRKILQHLEELARENDCNKLVLDSYTENKKSHPLYFSEDFYVRGFHFMKDL